MRTINNAIYIFAKETIFQSFFLFAPVHCAEFWRVFLLNAPVERYTRQCVHELFSILPPPGPPASPSRIDTRYVPVFSYSFDWHILSHFYIFISLCVGICLFLVVPLLPLSQDAFTSCLFPPPRPIFPSLPILIPKVSILSYAHP